MDTRAVLAQVLTFICTTLLCGVALYTSVTATAAGTDFWPTLWGVTGPSLVRLVVIVTTGFALLAGGFFLATILGKRIDPEWGQTHLSVDGDVLRTHRKPLFRSPQEIGSVSLDAARYVTWDISLFHDNPPTTIEFWDQDPNLTLMLLGLCPTNPEARNIGSIGVPESPRDRDLLRAVIGERLESGQIIDCNFDLDTFEPIPEKLPPVEPGTRLEGRNVIYDPSSIETSTV